MTLDRFERRCPRHRLPLVAGVAPLTSISIREVLTCPDGHEVDSWIVANEAAFATFERVTLIAPFDPPSDFGGDGWTSGPSSRAVAVAATHGGRHP